MSGFMRGIIIALMVGMWQSVAVADPRAEVSEAADWRAEALASMEVTEEELDAHTALRCIKLNNYTCLRLAKGASYNWNGQTGLDYGRHIAFSKPEYSLRAQMRDYCSKKRRGVVSARDVKNANQPWCDTLGSHATYNGWGRTCNDGGKKPPATFDGPLCKRPDNGVPLPGQCSGCNCPDETGAESMIKGIEIEAGKPLSITADMGLFNTDGTVNKTRARQVLRNVVFKETGGMYPNDDVLERAFALVGTCK